MRPRTGGARCAGDERGPPHRLGSSGAASRRPGRGVPSITTSPACRTHRRPTRLPPAVRRHVTRPAQRPAPHPWSSLPRGLPVAAGVSTRALGGRRRCRLGLDGGDRLGQRGVGQRPRCGWSAPPLGESGHRYPQDPAGTETGIPPRQAHGPPGRSCWEDVLPGDVAARPLEDLQLHLEHAVAPAQLGELPALIAGQALAVPSSTSACFIHPRRHDSAIPRSNAIFAMGCSRRRANSTARRRNSDASAAGTRSPLRTTSSPQKRCPEKRGGGPRVDAAEAAGASERF